MLMAQVIHRAALEWKLAGDHLEEDDAKGVKIGTDVDGTRDRGTARGPCRPGAQPNARASQARV